MSVITALRRLRQEDLQFETSLNYITRPYLKRKKKLVLKRKSVAWGAITRIIGDHPCSLSQARPGGFSPIQPTQRFLTPCGWNRQPLNPLLINVKYIRW
jgi:hypothetical protein